MPNPFIFGEVVRGDSFTDREEELRTLKLDLESGQNVLLFSPRRYGKTSLILRVLEELKAEGFICVYVDLFPVTSLLSLAKVYANAITQANASKLQEAVQFIKDHFPAIVPKITVKGTEGPAEFELDFEAPRRDIEKWLDEIYEMPQKMAENKKKKWVVVFDEFQEVAALTPAGAVERRLRSKIQHHNRVAYVFMGSKRHLLDEMFLDKNKPLYRIAKSVPLGKIPNEKLAAFVTERFKSAGMTIQAAEVERTLQLTGGLPYYTQQLCHEIYNAVVGRKTVEVKDVDAGCEACLKAQSYAYLTIWESLALTQKNLVVALAKSQGAAAYSQEFLTEFSLGAAGTVQRAMAALLKKSVVERENSHYVLTDVFFAEWIRRKTG